jgi:hypothetical protein
LTCRGVIFCWVTALNIEVTGRLMKRECCCRCWLRYLSV